MTKISCFFPSFLFFRWAIGQEWFYNRLEDLGIDRWPVCEIKVPTPVHHECVGVFSFYNVLKYCDKHHIYLDLPFSLDVFFFLEQVNESHPCSSLFFSFSHIEDPAIINTIPSFELHQAHYETICTSIAISMINLLLNSLTRVIFSTIDCIWSIHLLLPFFIVIHPSWPTIGGIFFTWTIIHTFPTNKITYMSKWCDLFIY